MQLPVVHVQVAWQRERFTHQDAGFVSAPVRASLRSRHTYIRQCLGRMHRSLRPPSASERDQHLDVILRVIQKILHCLDGLGERIDRRRQWTHIHRACSHMINQGEEGVQ